MSDKPTKPTSPPPAPQPSRQPTHDGGRYGNNDRGGKVDPIYRVPPSPPRPPGGDKK